MWDFFFNKKYSCFEFIAVTIIMNVYFKSSYPMSISIPLVISAFIITSILQDKLQSK